MENSGLDIHSQILKDRASGYQILGTLLVNAPYLDIRNAYATAGIYSTVEDLFLWDQALYSNQLLSQGSLESMYTPNYVADGSGGEYGYGWQIGEFQGLSTWAVLTAFIPSWVVTLMTRSRLFSFQTSKRRISIPL